MYPVLPHVSITAAKIGRFFRNRSRPLPGKAPPLSARLPFPTPVRTNRSSGSSGRNALFFRTTEPFASREQESRPNVYARNRLFRKKKRPRQRRRDKSGKFRQPQAPARRSTCSTFYKDNLLRTPPQAPFRTLKKTISETAIRYNYAPIPIICFPESLRNRPPALRDDRHFRVSANIFHIFVVF